MELGARLPRKDECRRDLLARDLDSGRSWRASHARTNLLKSASSDSNVMSLFWPTFSGEGRIVVGMLVVFGRCVG
jgi:hypothetical protein